MCFKSLFAGRLTKFIGEKKSLGFLYDYAYPVLKTFDKMCAERFPAESVLTEKLVTAWAKRRGNEQNQTMRTRHTYLREFAKYLISTGESAYLLPTKIVSVGAKPVPYVFTEEEILAFWSAVDKLKPRCNSPYRHITLPVMFRVIYCCGLRPQEARRLCTDEVDANAGRIFIRESKARADRLVMMNDDVAQMCLAYEKKMHEILPVRTAYFPSGDGGEMSHDVLGMAFDDVWGKAGLQYSGYKKPTTYSFRHTFATHRLYRWMGEGKDITAMLPYLSAYMGHKSLTHTYYYIHYVPGMMASMSGVDYTYFQDLLPEVNENE